MRIISIVSLLVFSLGCRETQVVPTRRVGTEVRFQCQGPRRGKPPSHWYQCTIDVLDVASEDRWLLMPMFMEDGIALSHKVVINKAYVHSEGEFAHFSLGYHTAVFDALPVPAGTRLHLEKWRIESLEDARQMAIWLGANPRLSNGDSLSVVFQRLRTRTAEVAEQPEPGSWYAPPGTTLQLAPEGVRQIQVGSPEP